MFQPVGSHRSRRIARNSAILYVRTIFTMLIGFFTSRIVLENLGVQDYGIYNVVGGITSMFIFLNSTMSVSTSRFITYELGKGNPDHLRLIYCQAKIIHYIIAIIIFILIETVGLWFVYHKLTIPPDRFQATLYILHTVSVGTILGIIATPDIALVISHERLNAFAYITMLDSVLRFVVAYLIAFVSGDRLIWYALLMLLVFGIERVCFFVYSKIKFPESRGKLVYNKTVFRSMLSFAGWNILGNIATMTREQGLTIIINIFTNPIVNAARAITTQVSNAITVFVYNVRTAVNPQITKSYAEGNYDYMHKLLAFSSLSCFYVLLAISIPLMCIADEALAFWLVEVPEYSASFFRLALVGLLIYSFTDPLIVGIQATGRIRKFQIIEGVLLLTTLPLIYVFFKMGYSPEWAYVAIIISNVVTLCGDIWVILPTINYPLSKYLKEIIVPACKVTLLSAAVPVLHMFLQDKFTNGYYPYLIAGISFVVTIAAICLLGLNRTQKQQIVQMIKRKIIK